MPWPGQMSSGCWDGTACPCDATIIPRGSPSFHTQLLPSLSPPGSPALALGTCRRWQQLSHTWPSHGPGGLLRRSQSSSCCSPGSSQASAGASALQLLPAAFSTCSQCPPSVLPGSSQCPPKVLPTAKRSPGLRYLQRCSKFHPTQDESNHGGQSWAGCGCSPLEGCSGIGPLLGFPLLARSQQGPGPMPPPTTLCQGQLPVADNLPGICNSSPRCHFPLQCCSATWNKAAAEAQHLDKAPLRGKPFTPSRARSCGELITPRPPASPGEGLERELPPGASLPLPSHRPEEMEVAKRESPKRWAGTASQRWVTSQHHVIPLLGEAEFMSGLPGAGDCACPAQRARPRWWPPPRHQHLHWLHTAGGDCICPWHLCRV